MPRKASPSVLSSRTRGDSRIALFKMLKHVQEVSGASAGQADLFFVSFIQGFLTELCASGKVQIPGLGTFVISQHRTGYKWIRFIPAKELRKTLQERDVPVISPETIRTNIKPNTFGGTVTSKSLYDSLVARALGRYEESSI